MNIMRKLLFIFTAVVLAAFALPSVGAPQFTKLYALTMTSNSPLHVTATLTNVSPDGNSSISSFQYIVAFGAKIDTAVLTAQDPRNVGVVSVAADKKSVLVTGIYPLKPGAPAVVLEITLLDCGDNISWNANVWTGTTGQVFMPNPTNLLPITTPVICGTIACGATGVNVPSSSYTASVTRGFYDKDGISTIGINDCATVPYSVTDLSSVLAGEKHFAWPLTATGDDAAAFEYKFNSAGPLTQVGWLEYPAGNAVLITGLACLPRPTLLTSPAVLPAPYGVLAAADTTGASTILVDTTGAVVAHPGTNVAFDVIIGTDRLTVSYNHGPANNETWKVIARDVGNTSGPLGSLGQRVMYTPLPLLSSTFSSTATPDQTSAGYVNSLQTQICIKHQYSVAEPYVIFIDIGDAWHAP